MARKAARVDDSHSCPLTTPEVHVGGPILAQGAPNTLFNGKHAARVTDKATCVAPAPDTVRGGLITVFIDGSPASRELDNTDKGFILAGSPDILLGESSGGPLTPFQAQWLYMYLADQKDIPFEFATDGCFARADRMSEFIASLGLPVQKQWVWRTPQSGMLSVPIADYPDGGVTWRWHVAPVVPVLQPDGSTEPMVLDPSLALGGPVAVGDWIAKQTMFPDDTVTMATPPNVYYHHYNEKYGKWEPAEDRYRDPNTTAKDLENYRRERAALPASSGRNVPNAPVHF